MKPTDEIRAEHRIIARVLSSMERTADALAEGNEVAPDLIREELDFIKNFADACHHRKEEAILFPALEGQLPLKHHDPVPELLKDHEEGRALVASLTGAVERYAAGDRDEGRKISSLLQTYRALLVGHIRAENTVLIEMVEADLPADKKIEVAERFEAVEEELGPAYHKKYAELAEHIHRQAEKLAA